MKPVPVCLFFLLLILSCAQQHKLSATDHKELESTIQQNLEEARLQYHYLMQQLPASLFPRNYNPATDSLQTSGSNWWCSGFYPGSLLLLYKETKDTTLYKEALRMLQLLEKEKNNRSTHDLGFMMFCSFGNAAKIEPKPEYDEILMTSARSLASRFNPVTGCIKSWESKPGDFLVIIDNMMNLELLFWATEHSGDSSFYKIAVTHANTTMKNHYRADYSSWHVVNYDPVTGAIKERKTAQGYSDESAWARGQAWGLYGYTATYRHTKDPRYLEQARKIAGFLLHHPNYPKDGIPYWDFNAPDIPHALRDASAGAIMASALIELSAYVEKKEAATYHQAAETILRTLSTPAYKSAPQTNGGFLLKHSVGHFPQKSEVDVSLTYADYYFIEAMLRIRNRNRAEKQ